MSPKFLTLADMTETLNSMMPAAHPLVTSGGLPTTQVGGKRAWYVREAMLERYIREQYATTYERIARHSL